MAAITCRSRLFFSKLAHSFEKRILISASNSRTYNLASSSVIFRNIYSLKLSDDKVLSRYPSGATVFRLYSSEKKLTVEEITEKVLNVCKTFDRIPAEKLSVDAHFMEDLGLDSLDHVELVMNIEDDFNFEIPDADAEKLLRPRDIVAYIEQKEQAHSPH